RTLGLRAAVLPGPLSGAPVAISFEVAVSTIAAGVMPPGALPTTGSSVVVIEVKNVKQSIVELLSTNAPAASPEASIATVIGPPLMLVGGVGHGPGEEASEVGVVGLFHVPEIRRMNVSPPHSAAAIASPLGATASADRTRSGRQPAATRSDRVPGAGLPAGQTRSTRSLLAPSSSPSIIVTFP